MVTTTRSMAKKSLAQGSTEIPAFSPSQASSWNSNQSSSPDPPKRKRNRRQTLSASRKPAKRAKRAKTPQPSPSTAYSPSVSSSSASPPPASPPPVSRHQAPSPPPSSPPLPPHQSSPPQVSPRQNSHRQSPPVDFWSRDQNWPHKVLSGLQQLLPQPKHSSMRRRNQSGSLSSSSLASGSLAPGSNGRRSKSQKSGVYGSNRYELALELRGSLMNMSKKGAQQSVSDESMTMCKSLLKKKDVPPSNGTLFDDDVFGRTCENIQNKGEAKIIQDIARLIVPSAEALASFGATHLDVVVEAVDEVWSNAQPITRPPPQPGYSLGFKRQAFDETQLEKMAPFLGDIVNGERSPFLGPRYMYFPFFSCEVKCGSTGLDVADRQNAHSMTVAIKGIISLFRAVQLEHQVNRRILSFSVSHNHRCVRIYGHYPVLSGDSTEILRLPVHTFDFTAMNGKRKWTCHSFITRIYKQWVPKHFSLICSAIDALPDVSTLVLNKKSQDSASLGASGASPKTE